MGFPAARATSLIAFTLCACASQEPAPAPDGSAEVRALLLAGIMPAAAPKDVSPETSPALRVSHPYELYFPVGSAQLDLTGREIVKRVAGNAWLVQPTRIVVAGYADRSGDPVHDQQLSERRARAVGLELIRAGVPRERISIRAYGAPPPAALTRDGAAHPKHRGVVIRML